MTSEAEATKSITERLLSDAFRGAVRLDDGTAVEGRDYVLRFNVQDGPAAMPERVISKRARSWGMPYDPDSPDPNNPAHGLLADWTGLELLSQVAGDAEIAPRFYGGDRALGLIVIEDLGTGDRPDHLMLGDDPAAAEAVMVELAAKLGTMHARTVGRTPDFEAIRARLGARTVQDRHRDATLGTALRATIDVLGVAPPPGLDDELRLLTEAIMHPGPFLAYTHGDPCPDNWLRVDGKLRLLDFEGGRFRHALIDGVYGRIHFPTCWCVNRTPAHVTLRMEAAYRAELVKGCAEAADDARYFRAVVEGCAYWAIGMCEWIVQRESWYEEPRAMQQDQRWGIATLRQRALVRSDILSRTTQELGHLEAIGHTFARMAAKLRTIWPPEADAMPLYPAFRKT